MKPNLRALFFALFFLFKVLYSQHNILREEGHLCACVSPRFYINIFKPFFPNRLNGQRATLSFAWTNRLYSMRRFKLENFVHSRNSWAIKLVLQINLEPKGIFNMWQVTKRRSHRHFCTSPISEIRPPWRGSGKFYVYLQIASDFWQHAIYGSHMHVPWLFRNF